MNILYVIEGKIPALIKWTYRSLPILMLNIKPGMVRICRTGSPISSQTHDAFLVSVLRSSPKYTF